MVSNEIERAIDEIVQATRDLEYSRRYQGKATVEADEMSFEDAKDALIALLARDDARIARLEDVAFAARNVALCLEGMPEYRARTDAPDREHIIETKNDLKRALVALDGPVDPSAPTCGRCGKALSADELTYYHDRCETCERIADAELVAAFETDDADAPGTTEQAGGTE